MTDLSAYPNVYNTAIVVLERKGFHIHFSKDDVIWRASKVGWKFVADDPIQLLGLVAIFEHQSPTAKNEYWWKIDTPDRISQLDPG